MIKSKIRKKILNIRKKKNKQNIKFSFSKISKIIKKNNLKVQGITSQREFLINMGILERAEMISKKLKFTDKANIFYRIRKLIDNKEMGKLFKFMLITNKNIKFKTGFKVD